MVRLQVDNRIRYLIENGVTTKHRCMFVVGGERARDQVVVLYHLLSRSLMKARPSVLWCYKKDLGFSSHRNKKVKQIKKILKKGLHNVDEDDPFETFVANTSVNYCYYKDTHRILGNTFNMCILQDFEALTPNLLARTIETVEGGGLIVFLLPSAETINNLHMLKMDVHARLQTEAEQNVVGRFNERFLQSLRTCQTCVIINDKLEIVSTDYEHIRHLKPIPPKPAAEALSKEQRELQELVSQLSDPNTPIQGAITKLCRTLDQGKVVGKLMELIQAKTLSSTAVLTAARGRGKSAALGLAMAAAVAFGYSNIYVTAPSPENLKTMFQFIVKGLKALAYDEYSEFSVFESTNPEFSRAKTRISVFKEHRQTIQYIHPTDADKLGQAELLCIDEAAAIPLPLVQKLMGQYLIFMSSTINGYEGTGRSLSLKLVQQLRQQSASFSSGAQEAERVAKGGLEQAGGAGMRSLVEMKMKESIRYAPEDPVEAWLSDLLCLDASTVPRISSGCPTPDSCHLYYVDRDALFSYHRNSEQFLQRIMSLYVSSHYKNSPNDLQMLSDAPAHHIFVLLGPMSATEKKQSSRLPEVLCVLQVCLEGKISKASIARQVSRSGDLIPWTLSTQFADNNFPGLSGARVIRIATHPDYQGMGYGSRALTLLKQYYEGRIHSVAEDQAAGGSSKSGSETPGKPGQKSTLLLELGERRPERLHYLGVSYGLTSSLLRFWKKAGFVPVYLRQTANDLTGEHSCIMLQLLTAPGEEAEGGDWLPAFWKDFRCRFVKLLSHSFRSFLPGLAMNVVQNKKFSAGMEEPMDVATLRVFFKPHDLKRLEQYANNLVDYHLVVDLIPDIARLYFTQALPVKLTAVQAAILLGLGLQHKTVDQLSRELEGTPPVSQLLGLFNKVILKAHKHFLELESAEVEKGVGGKKDVSIAPLDKTMDEELDEAAATVKQQEEQLKLQDLDLSQYAVVGSEDDFLKAAAKATPKLTHTLGKLKKRKLEEGDPTDDTPGKKRKKKDKKKKNKQHT